jgi:RNA polymerase sigma factor (sigma-70 family)
MTDSVGQTGQEPLAEGEPSSVLGVSNQTVRRAIAGDPDAQGQLWRHTRRYVAAVLLAHKPRNADLDDLLQDVAGAMVRKVHTVDDPGAVLGWLRMVALNVARLSARKAAVRNERSLDAMIDAGRATIPDRDQTESGDASARSLTGDALAHHARLEQARSLLTMAQALPPEYREPLLLKCTKDLSYRQIGQALGLPETTIETRIARARKMLREAAAKAAVDA